MRKWYYFVLGLVACAPFAANAAGTYYNGAYQSPQAQRYNNAPYAARQTGGYSQNTSYSATRRVTANPNAAYTGPAQSRNASNGAAAQNTQKASESKKSGGFWLDAGVSREFAMWDFSMNESGSKLHYDNISWNVLDVRGGYSFGFGNTGLAIDAGLKYGFQSGDSTMVDDDITNGGYFITEWENADTGAKIGKQIGHALSIGSSKGGNMFGFNAGLGLTDVLKVGNLRMTPSVGWRYFKYKLKTERNHGLAVETGACFDIGGETQCDPILIFETNVDGQQSIIWRSDSDSPMTVPEGATMVSPAGTYYYYQPGTSHSYEVAWSGPYIALDMDYDINKNNAVNARVELGLPSYNATGDQPYRFDWQHPKSVEDKAGLFSAFHFGLGANWTTALTDSVALSIGLTYDYYSVGGADAKTYLNPSYYDEVMADLLTQWQKADHEGATLADMLNSETGWKYAINVQNNIDELKSECSGWVCKASGEIESFYKSMGIRVGVRAKF